MSTQENETANSDVNYNEICAVLKNLIDDLSEDEHDEEQDQKDGNKKKRTEENETINIGANYNESRTILPSTCTSDSDSESSDSIDVQSEDDSQAHEEDHGRKRWTKRKMSAKLHLPFDVEYCSLPPIEKLSINVKEDEKLEKFGTVDSHVEFIVKIKPLNGVPHLGYETILLDSDKNPVGEIFEIFGTVTDTMYAIRFNSKEEAFERMPIGKDVYYVASNAALTKTVFPQELAKIKNWERLRINPEDPSSEELFSDDEEEQRILAKRRQKTRQRNYSDQSKASKDIPANKKTKVDLRSNSFHPKHNQWQQQRNFQQQYPHYYAPPCGYALPSYLGTNMPMPGPFYNIWPPPPPPPTSCVGSIMSMPNQSYNAPQPPAFYQPFVPPLPPPQTPPEFTSYFPQPAYQQTSHQFFNTPTYTKKHGYPGSR